MDHFLEINQEAKNYLNGEIFPSIYSGQTILFLGAGASVVDKKYLGQQIIDYYEGLLGINAGTNDLIEFVDIISARNDFRRDDFDNYVAGLLTKLKPQEAHRTISRINWSQVITTNLDLIIERAHDELVGTPLENKTFKVIRSAGEFHGTVSSNFIKYIKLNGCIKDKNKYPFIFSTKDFELSKAYHKLVLKSLADFTPDIKFLSIGYSFSDDFSRSLIDYFDSYSFRYKRPMISIDPFVPDARLDFLKEKNIYVIKISGDEFFKLYNEWVEKYSEIVSYRKNISFTDLKDQSIGIPKHLKLGLGNYLVQLSDLSRIPSTPPKSFYEGERPSYDAIRRNLDVIKQGKLQTAKSEVLKVFKTSNSRLLPIIFLTGLFGSGKSTFLYRLVYSILHDPSCEAVAYEFYEPANLKTAQLGELFKYSKAKNIILTGHEVELDSLFKELMRFRANLSSEQFSDFNICFIISIRENILEKFLRSYQYKDLTILNIDDKFNLSEATELVSKLEQYDLLRFRDAQQRREVTNRILNDYAGDTFISLFSILQNRNFELLVESAYNQLSKKAQEAFICTSIVYQFKILMPSALLMRIVSKDWKTFEDEVMRYDSKGILIQEKSEYRTGEPDLFFRTKHPVISQILIKRVLSHKDDVYKYLKKIIVNLNDTDRSAELFVDLIKSLRNRGGLQQSMINNLFDIADPIFVINPHFTLHYAMNLQKRRSEVYYKKAINKILLAEGSLERRNHRLVHRRAILNYELAKSSLKKEKEILKTQNFINEARELFEIKRIEDPFSSYSYADYINLELWVLNNLKLNDRELLLLHVKIQELFDIASRAVYEDTDRIIRLKGIYLRHVANQKIDGKQALNDYLDELYEDSETRPYALILRYNFLNEKSLYADIPSVIKELEFFNYLDEVSRLLFRYYGRNLYLMENRQKLFNLQKENKNLVANDPLRFHFYNYIAESYNKNFSYSRDHLYQISQLDVVFNPELHEVWRDENAQEVVFNGIIDKQSSHFQIKVSEMQKNFYMLRESVNKFKPTQGKKYLLKLHFFLKGIRVELLDVLK